MSRGIDHIVHAVHDLDAAAAFYRGLGFTVGARNRHPPTWGTQNHIVQFSSCFIELLALADTSKTVPHGPRHFSFGAFNRDFLARGQGLSMLVLEGAGAKDSEEFRASGIGDFDVFDFEREARRADGSAAKVAFSLAFARNSQAPDAGFFSCRHHFPDNFWNAAFQKHSNTAASIAGVILVANRPGDHCSFLSAFLGEREVIETASGVRFTTSRGDIEVVTPSAFRERFGTEPPDGRRGARLAAIRLVVRDLKLPRGAIRQAAASSEKHPVAIVGPDAAFGATLVFERR